MCRSISKTKSRSNCSAAVEGMVFIMESTSPSLRPAGCTAGNSRK